MNVTRKSMITGIEHTLDLDITEEQVVAYEMGALIQDVFPHLSDAEREFIKTGITAEEWQQHMAPPPEDIRVCAECDEPSLSDSLDVNETPWEWQCPHCDNWNDKNRPDKKKEAPHA